MTDIEDEATVVAELARQPEIDFDRRDALAANRLNERFQFGERRRSETLGGEQGSRLGDRWSGLAVQRCQPGGELQSALDGGRIIPATKLAEEPPDNLVGGVGRPAGRRSYC
ncbi:MAG: hypothetical protein KatS3mg060_3144 [Dehalococcoidia bacterium]|nr:MAG: hypothetical protein KatS3mg060_3144 [Dehalococcoidia bacterium]